MIAAVIRRDFADTRSYHLAFLFDLFFGVLELATYFFISEAFGDVVPEDLQGAPDYFAFAAVGIVIATIITAATVGISDGLRREQTTGTLEALVTNPITSIELCLGLVGFPFLYAAARSVLYLVIAGLWMDLDLSHASVPGIVLVFGSATLALSTLGILSGAVVLVLKRGDVLVGTFVYMLTLISGSVFPVSTLPNWLEAIGELSPLRLAFDGTRAALFEGGGWAGDVAVLTAIGVVGMPVVLLAFSRALAFAKRAGSISQY